MKLKKEKLSRLIIAGLMAGSIGLYTNVSSAATVQVDNGSVTIGVKDFETSTGNLDDRTVTIQGVASQNDVWSEADERREANAQMGGEISALRTENGQQQTDIENLKAENATQSEQIGDLGGQISDEYRDRVAADNALNEKVDAAQSGVDEVRDGLATTNGDVSKLINENKTQQEQLDSQQSQLDDHQSQLDAVRGEVSEEHRVNAEQQEQLDDHQQQLDEHREQLDTVRGEISTEIADRTEADKELHNRIDNIELEANEAVGVVGKENLAQEYKDTNYLADADTMVNADKALDNAIYNVNNRVDGLDSRVSSLEDRMGDVEDRIDKVGAMAAAIANLRTMGYDPEAPTEIAVGVGQYKSETGLALGVFHYPNEDFMLSASISTSSDEVMGGIGATWKIGRKSAAEKERTVEEKRVEKAEEMQDLAKKERVNAQRERHAKMLAEREAANK
ncbi:YadA-like family protein [Megamonas hypermegale]|uniref:YadA-like family protein n=1 Tax=Megamonas hypermegale TaxID=158847 RepID=UPI00320921F1